MTCKAESQDHVTASLHRVVDCIRDCVWLAVSQATEWQRVGDQINAVLICSKAESS